MSVSVSVLLIYNLVIRYKLSSISIKFINSAILINASLNPENHDHNYSLSKLLGLKKNLIHKKRIKNTTLNKSDQKGNDHLILHDMIA